MGVLGWTHRRGRDRGPGRKLALLIQAGSLFSAEVEEPYCTGEFTEAQGGRATGPRLQGRSLRPRGKVVTHYSLTLWGTVDPVTAGPKSSEVQNTWLVPKMRCRVSFGVGVTHGFGMCCEGVW